MTLIDLTGSGIKGGQTIGREGFPRIEFSNCTLHICELLEMSPILCSMHEARTPRSLVRCFAIFSNKGNRCGSRNGLGEVCTRLDTTRVTTTRNGNAKLWMKSMSPDEVHVEVSDPMVSKIVAITRTSGEREHIEMEVLELGRLAICFSIYISEANFIFVKDDVGFDNSSVVGLLLSTSLHVVRKEYQ